MPNFLNLSDAGGDAIAAMLADAIDRKAARVGWPKARPDADKPLADHVLAMVFEKNSTRTRCSFDLAIRQLGGVPMILDAGTSQLGRGETIADTARVLSRYVDAIMIRILNHEALQELAAHATVPVINGLTRRSHPCQVMADLMTFEEHRGPIAGRTVAWTGDDNNVLASWAHAAERFKFKLNVATPPELAPDPALLAWAAEHPERLVPFCRLDPADDPLPELDRCLERGARGVKLHPRAQVFDFTHGALAAIFRRAHEADVPVLIHAGRGMAPIAERLCDLALEHPAPVILAHAGIADQAVFAVRLREHPRAFFDTSVLSPADLAELFARVPAERIVFASDPPYGRPIFALYMLLRVARANGATDEALRRMLSGTIDAVLTGRDPAPATAPIRPRAVAVPGAVARLYPLLYHALSSAVHGSLAGVNEALELAEAVCRDPEPGDMGPTLERVAAGLAAVRASIDRGERFPADLLHLLLVDVAAVAPHPS